MGAHEVYQTVASTTPFPAVGQQWIQTSTRQDLVNRQVSPILKLYLLYLNYTVQEQV